MGLEGSPGMNYLYGDSTVSTLKSNFLEFIRDALDFSVFVLQTDARIKQGHLRVRVLGDESDAETRRLERFITSVTRAVDTGDKGESESPTARCAARLATLIDDTHQASLDGIQKNLADAIAQIEADETAARDACLKALGTLLAPHDPPGASTVLRLGLLDSGRYSANLEATSEPALEWTLEVSIPDGHLWSSPMRIDKLVPQLEIGAPQLAGWITKEVKVRPQRIERWIVTRIVDDGTTVSIEIRMEPTSGVGIDFEVRPKDGKVVKAKRVGPAQDPSAGPFELQAQDVAPVVELAKKLRKSLDGLERQPKISATFDGADFRTQPDYVHFIERLVGMMAPICREIAQRSLTPNELVLRRLLANDRREEIFVAKATLREKLAVLPPESQALFAPLGLDAPGETRPPVPTDEGVALRSELPPSTPPAPSEARAEPNATPLPVPATASTPPPSSGTPSSNTLRPPHAVPPPKNDPSAKRTSSDPPQAEVIEEVELSSDALIETAPETARPVVSKPEGSQRNEVLVAALKKIMRLSKNGRAVEAYQEYANLFSSEAFAGYPPDEQRRALKLMVLAKTHPSDTNIVRSAHKAALIRLKALVEKTGEPDPADHELLGVAHLYLGDEKAASAAFQAGLTLERTKNPKSELVSTLMRRVSEL